MVNQTVSDLIGDIYLSPFENKIWLRVLDVLKSRTGSHFVFVSSVDLRKQEYTQALWHGREEGRFWDGVEEYNIEQVHIDPSLNFGLNNPYAGVTGSRSALLVGGRDPDNDPYVRWCASQLGSGHNIVRYTPPHDDLILAC